MNDLMGRNKAKFRFDRWKITLKGEPYFDYRFTVEYLPGKEGDYTFGPAIFKGRAAESATGADVKGKDFFAVGPACTVRVVPPPEEGRPPTYIGAIGTNLLVETSLDTQTCNVGDPLTLTLRVSGNVSMDNLRPPDLSLQTRLARDFKVYGEPVKTAAREGAREYLYTVRPTTAGTIELPSVELSYYDTLTRAYNTSRSKPIPLRANEVAQVGYEIVIDASAGDLPDEETGAPLVAAPMDIDQAGARPCPIGPAPWHAAAVVLGPLAYSLALVVRRTRRRSPARQTAKRRRAAAADAMARIRALEASPGGDPEEIRRGLSDALSRYSGDRFGVASSSLTPADAKATLLDAGIREDTAESFRAVYDRAFRAAYSREAVEDAAPSGDCREARRLIEEIEQQAGSHRTPRAGTVLPILLLLLLSARTVDASEDARTSFLWRQANARMSSAKTGEEFLAAAGAYEELVGAGVRNGPLLYNLGLALLQSERHDEAIRAFLGAERYLGADEDLRRNLRLAYAGREETGQGNLPWYRFPLFWHFDLGTPVRTHVAVLAFAALWAALLLRAFGLRHISEPLFAVAVLAVVLFGSSAVTSMYQEANTDYTARVESAVPPETGVEEQP